MNTSGVIPSIAAPLPARRSIGALGLALSLGYLVVLFGTFLQGHFLLDLLGRPIDNDFVNVYAAGRLALDGHAAAAYDWPIHRAAEVRALGHDFTHYYGWPYPPTFLFAAAALATLPYLGALLTWLVATLTFCAATLRLVLGERIGILIALGFPASIWNVTAGQNGFLTASLIGATLGFLERRPVLAGVFLGLLTYKPQFGLLFPLVLIADRRWRTIAVAALVAPALAAASWLAFGAASWQAFLRAMPLTSRAVLDQGAGDWNRLQSLFGLIRAHGGSETIAWIMQGALSVALAIWLFRLWRTNVAFDIKAAALAAGALLATPYVYMYDMVALAVAIAFLLRLAFKRGFIASETAGLATACGLILIYPYLKTQVGFAAALIVMAAAMRRARADGSRSGLRPAKVPA